VIFRKGGKINVKEKWFYNDRSTQTEVVDKLIILVKNNYN